MRMITKNLEETHKAAEEFVTSLNALLKNGQMPSGATVIGLHGDLGSGKTSFVQGIAKAFGVEGNVISPTFVLQKRYSLKDHFHFKNMIHIDAYRLEKADEILPLGWNDITSDKKNIIFIEWPEKIGEHMPKSHKKIMFEFIDPENRKLEIL